MSEFLADDRGAETIEFILWLPIIGALLALMTDTSFLYEIHGETWNVARDTARRMVVGQLATEADAEAYALDQLAEYEYFFEASAVHDPTTQMSVTITVPVRDVAVFGVLITPVLGKALEAQVVMRSEPAGGP